MAMKKKEVEAMRGGAASPSPFGKPKPSPAPPMTTGAAPMPGPPMKKKIFGKPR